MTPGHLLITLTLLATPTLAVARDLTPAQMTTALSEALRTREDRAVLDWSDRLLARDDLAPEDRRWAHEAQIFALERLWHVCDGADAATAYLAEWSPTDGRADPDARVADVAAAAERMKAACRQLEGDEGPARPPEAGPEPTYGRGTLTASSGALATGSGFDRLKSAFEGSLGLQYSSGLQLEAALGLAFEQSPVFTLRPGLRLDLIDIVDGGPLQLRAALHAAIADAFFAPALLGGLEWPLPIGEAWGLQFGAGALLWLELALVSVEGRLGVHYVF